MNAKNINTTPKSDIMSTRKTKSSLKLERIPVQCIIQEAHANIEQSTFLSFYLNFWLLTGNFEIIDQSSKGKV